MFLIWTESCTGYTSGSDLQGETTTDSREDSRESRGGVLLVEKSDERVTACIPGAAEFPEPLPSKESFLTDLQQVTSVK